LRKESNSTSQKGDDDARTELSSNASSSEKSYYNSVEGPSYGTIVFSFLCFAPFQLVSSLFYWSIFICQQIILLPFRVCGGAPLAFMLRLWGPLMASVTFPYCANNYGQSCFGREVGEFESIDDFLETVSASKRKNIRRNQRAAQKEMDKHGIVVTMHPAGTWRFTTEFFALIGHQGSRHQEKFHGYPNVVHCNQPVSPFLVMFTEFLFILVFACDLQVFRTKEGKLISFNTRVHVGNCYFNPNYGCYEEYSKYGIYAWTNWDTMAEAIRLRATVANFMPSMKEAKK
jgi:hypothetical protein